MPLYSTALPKTNDKDGLIVAADLFVTAFLSCLSLHISLVASVLFFFYGTLRMLLSSKDDCFYLLLMLCANTNVFFMAGAPAANLLIIIAFLKLLLKGKIAAANAVTLTASVCFYEMLHAFRYTMYNVAQCFVWIVALGFPVLYISGINHYDHSKAKTYFTGGVLISTVYGCYYRVVTGRGFSVGSFSTYDAARFGGGMYDPNYYSMLCMIAMLLVLEQILLKSKTPNTFSKVPIPFYYAFLVALLYFCVAGLSRMFVVVFIIMILAYIPLLLQLNRASRRLIGAAVILAMVALTAVSITGYDIAALVDKTAARFSAATTAGDITGGRLSLIEKGVDYLTEHPFSSIFGVGVQSYGTRLGGIGYAHNTLMEIVETMGVMGGFLFLATFFTLSAQMKRRYGIAGGKSYIRFLPLMAFIIAMLSLSGIEVELFYTLFVFLLCEFHIGGEIIWREEQRQGDIRNGADA